MAVFQVAAFALAYIVGARMGVALAVPPDYASVVWPAAGVALSAYLVLSLQRATLAIALGAFLANLWNTSAGYSNVTWDASSTSAIMAAGAVFQGMFGLWLYRRYVPQDHEWNEVVALQRFCLIVALGGSIVSPTLGNLSLYIHGLMPSDRLLFNWVTWWVGDATGILLVTPMIQVLVARPPTFTAVRKLQMLLPMLVILAAVVGLFQKSVEHNRTRAEAELRREADHLARTVELRLTVAENKLSAYSALFSASEHVSPEEFALFSSRVMASEDAFHGIGWTEILDHDGRLAWEAKVRVRGFDDFVIRELDDEGNFIEAPVREEYYPVLYIYPFEQNRKAFGLNLAANPARKAALLQASDTALPVATAPITLAQETEGQRATIVYMPVFAEAPDQLIGFASGVMRVSGILGDSIERARQNHLLFSLYDVTDEEAPLYVAEAPAQTRSTVLQYEEWFAGRQYRLDIYPAADFRANENDWTSYVILTGGFLIAALFLMFVLTTTGVIENVTRQVQARTRELEQAVEKANAANQAKSAFLANMSHELRTPLNAISGFLKLVLDSQLTSRQREYLQKAELASGTLLGLINQTLNYAKIESGKMELEQGSVRMRAIARKMEALFSQVADENGLAFNIRLGRDVPDVLIGDELRIEQITLNLLSNAFKFTRAGHVSLTIQYDAESSTLSIRVADSGQGIAADKLQHIFSAFGQADASTSRRFGGTGLGLSISRRLARLMNGDIAVESQEGEGAEFCAQLELPVGEAVPLSDRQQQANLANMSDKCVLVVEDIEVNQMIVKEFLRKYDLHCVIAENGEEAVNRLKDNHAIDLVLMDIQMPVMDGYTATRLIREFAPDLPIIGMTANAMDDDKRACLATGMNDHIAKPIDPELLGELLHRYLA